MGTRVVCERPSVDACIRHEPRQVDARVARELLGWMPGFGPGLARTWRPRLWLHLGHIRYDTNGNATQ